MTIAGMYISSALLSAVGAWVITRSAGRLGLVDLPNERSSHSRPTPKGGGIGVLAAFVFVSVFASFPVLFWVPAACIGLVGFLTDRIDFSPKARLPFQFAAAIVFLAFGMLFDASFGFSPLCSRLPALMWVFCILLFAVFIVGTANFYNFMDGINGIAGITGIVGFGLLGLYLQITNDHSSLKILVISLSLACAGFLPFNIPGARVFMGDVGSILLGFVFAGTVVLISRSLLDFICLTSFLFPFYADELTTMAVRITHRDNLLKPHRRHIYQLLANERGIAHWKVSVGYGLLQVAVGLSILWIRPFGLFPVLCLLAAYFLGFTLFGYALRKNVAALKRA